MDLLAGAEGIAFRVSGGLSRFKRTSGPLSFYPGGLKSLFCALVSCFILVSRVDAASRWR
jgi:hypothetical protein